MDDRAGLNSGAGPMRAGLEIDAGALDAWLRANVAGYAGPLAIEQFRGGQSNPTYRLTTPGAAYVLRRKPPGALLPGAHAVEREYRVLAALGPTAVPVPRVHGLCEDAAVIGTPFYVMDAVAGRIFWAAELPGLAAPERACAFDAMNAGIAALHAIDPAAVGLSDYGRSANYVGRQVARWTRQYLDDPAAGRDPYLEKLIEWLPAHLPPDQPPAISHGDYRCDNLIFDAAAPRVAAVLDWELSTLGDPLADFAFHAMIWRVGPEVLVGLVGQDLAALGIPSEDAYLAAYCDRTGRGDLPHYDTYVAFGLFRLAGIVHGIKGRIARGTAASAHAHDTAARFEAITRAGWAQVAT